MRFQYDTIGETYDACQFVQGMIPTNGVYRTSYAAELSALSTAAAGTVLGARSVKPDTGNARVFLGSGTKIEEITATGITDRSKAGGYSTSNRWWFSQGVAPNEVVAANITHTIQTSSGAGFSDLANAPKALIVLAQSEALLALNYIDGATSVPNGIKISDRGDSTVWQDQEGNDAASIRLVETPGEIYAGATLNDIVVVWKQNSMYVGRFVGGAEKWQFNLLSPHIGCLGPEAWASTPAGIVFAGPAGVYIFDGAVPREVDVGVRQVILNDISSDNGWGYKVQMSHDEYSSCVFLWVPTSATAFNCYAFNYRENRWSMAYPMRDLDTEVVYDFGVTGVSGLQSVVRDLHITDYARLTNTAGRYAGHFIVAGDKKIYNLAKYSTSVEYKVCSRITTGRFKVEAPPGTDLVLRRIYPVFAAGFLFSNTPADLKCSVNAYAYDHLERDSPASATAATWDNNFKRFDVFATGKTFDAQIYSVAGEPFSLKALRFDFMPAGKV